MDANIDSDSVKAWKARIVCSPNDALMTSPHRIDYAYEITDLKFHA